MDLTSLCLLILFAFVKVPLNPVKHSAGLDVGGAPGRVVGASSGPSDVYIRSRVRYETPCPRPTGADGRDANPLRIASEVSP